MDKKFFYGSDHGWKKWLAVAPYVLVLGSVGSLASAAEEDEAEYSALEEIIVTSEKRESTAQDTALALSAFDENALDRENINDALDIQFSVPNLLYSKSNFAGSNLSIRGIGNNAVSATADSGAGVHFNGFYQVASSIFEAEFYDVARIEILRGPQGTLYGRNTTAGVFNVVPNKPNQEFEANAQLEFGDFGARKYISTVNLPVQSWFQVRSSLFRLQRDGYVLNEQTGNYVDDRNSLGSRVSFRLGGGPNSAFEMNIIYDHFAEEDTRMRTSKQVCHQDRENRTYPNNLGCLPGQSLYSGDRFGSPTSFSQLGGIFAGIFPFAAAPGNPLFTDATTGAPLTFSPTLPFAPGLEAFQQLSVPAYFSDAYRLRNPEDLRTVNAVYDPYYMVEDRVGVGDMKWDLGSVELNYLAGRQKRELDTNTDYFWTTGANGPVPFNCAAVAAWNFGFLSQGAPALLGLVGFDPAAGTPAGNPTIPTALAGLQSACTDVENPLHLQLGRLLTQDSTTTGNGQGTNGLRGIAAWDRSNGISDSKSDEFRITTDFGGWFNMLLGGFRLDFTSSGGYEVHSNTLAITGATPDLTYFNSVNGPYNLDSEATFVELYLGGEDFRVTLGGRTTTETKEFSSRQTLANNPTLEAINGLTGRACLNTPLGWTFGWASGGACANNAIPNLTVRSRSWNEDTWKFGVDFKVAEGSLMYIIGARSYKSGGLNPPSFSGAFPDTFEPEFVESFEWGIKNSIAGKANLNLTYFYYDYTGLQISKIVDRTSVNENVDAINQGLELEVAWAPTDRWRFDYTASWLNTEIKGGNSINPADPANAYTDGDATDSVFFITKNSGADTYIQPRAAQGGTGPYTFGDDTTPYAFNAADCAVPGSTSDDDRGRRLEGGFLQCSSLFTFGAPTGDGTADSSVLTLCQQEGACTADSTVQNASNWLTSLSRSDQLDLRFNTCPEAGVDAIVNNVIAPQASITPLLAGLAAANSAFTVAAPADDDFARQQSLARGALLTGAGAQAQGQDGGAAATEYLTTNISASLEALQALESGFRTAIAVPGLQGVTNGCALFTQAPIGIGVDLIGNQLPNSPERSARLGVQYNVDLDGVNLALRADYYWQSDFYYRIFNTRQDLIESWNVVNFQASLTSFSGDWTMEFWVKNVRDKDFVTGAYFTDSSSGNFTNLFLLEPRTIGFTFKFRY